MRAACESLQVFCANGRKAQEWNSRWVHDMQNKTWSKCRESKMERQMEEGRKRRSLLYFSNYFFPIGIEASRRGFLTTWVLYVLCAKARCGSSLPASQTSQLGGTNTDDCSLCQPPQYLRAVACVGEEPCHCSSKGFHQAQAVFEASLQEWITQLFDAVTLLRKSVLPQIASWSQLCWALPW